MKNTEKAVPIASDNAYLEFEILVAARVRAITGPLFTIEDVSPTDTLFHTYLWQLPNNNQHYNCHACQRFINKFGCLVQLDQMGRLVSPLWSENNVPSFFRPTVMAMNERLVKGRINGVFITEDAMWGQPVTGVWCHLSGEYKQPFNATLLSADQKMAELKQDYILLFDTIGQYTISALENAIRVMEGDHLPSIERALANARWFHGLLMTVKDLKGTLKSNLVWSYVATAPTGYVHFKNGMLGTLLDDLKAGLPFNDVKAKWTEKMHPLQYQRPQAPPSAGTIKQAEEAFAKLDLGPSLQRKFARFEEIKTFWTPKISESEATQGLFSHLKPKSDLREPGVMALPVRTMTWSVFQRDILPKAKNLEYQTPAYGIRENFFGFISAFNPDSKPLLRWDTEPRNTVSSFVYINGSTATYWNLPSAAFVEVTGIAHNPWRWYHEYDDVHPGVSFILKGAHINNNVNSSAIFPEDVRGDLHGVRSVIEAYSKTSTILAPMEGTANGIRFSKNDKRSTQFRLRVNGNDLFIIDRWE